MQERLPSQVPFFPQPLSENLHSSGTRGEVDSAEVSGSRPTPHLAGLGSSRRALPPASSESARTCPREGTRQLERSPTFLSPRPGPTDHADTLPAEPDHHGGTRCRPRKPTPPLRAGRLHLPQRPPAGASTAGRALTPVQLSGPFYIHVSTQI